jgi:hypothetical protein
MFMAHLWHLLLPLLYDWVHVTGSNVCDGTIGTSAGFAVKAGTQFC